MQTEEPVLEYTIPDVVHQCSTCKNPVSGKFCSLCGQPSKLPRVNGHYIIHEIQHILHFEKGILYTVKELFSRPGKSVKEFIADDRRRLVKPVIFIIITSLIYTIISHFFHLKEEFITYQVNKHSATISIFSWITSHYGYANIIMGLFIAIWLKLFFKRYDYNVFEILILLCFVMGMGMLIFALFALVEGLTQIHLMGFAGVLGVTYCTWAIAQFFDSKQPVSYFKSLVAYLFGMTTFTVTAVFLGFMIDSLIS